MQPGPLVAIPSETRNAGRGTLIIVHGYGEHSARYDHVGAYFARHGYAVYMMDLRGHGPTPGSALGYFERFSQLSDDLHELIGYIRKNQSDEPTQHTQQTPLYLIGHSMGGLLALYYTAHHQDQLRALALSGALVPHDTALTASGAPLRLMVRTLNSIAPRLGVLPLDPRTLSRDPAVVSAYINDPNVYHGRIPACVLAQWLAATTELNSLLPRITLPALVMHGSADRLVNPGYARYIHEHLGSADKTLRYYDGLYHEILNEPERGQVLDDVRQWLTLH